MTTLKEMNKKEDANVLAHRIEELQQRIDKAIEYIEENTTDPEFVVSGELQENQVIELLKILKGE